jgi:hypothetical protein
MQVYADRVPDESMCARGWVWCLYGRRKLGHVSLAHLRLEVRT